MRNRSEQQNIDETTAGEKLCIRLNLNLDREKVKAWRDRMFPRVNTNGYQDILLVILADALKKEPVLASLGEDEIEAAAEIDINITV